MSEPKEVWRGDFAAVRLETCEHLNGAKYEQTLITVGSGLGVMVVPTMSFGLHTFIGVVVNDRPTTGLGYEFPRGGATALNALEARRVLVRETGIRSSALGRIGVFHPENGMVELVVAAYIATVPASHAAAADDFVDPDTGAIFSWISTDDFVELIRAGQVTDGITLATWALLGTVSRDHIRPGIPPYGSSSFHHPFLRTHHTSAK